MQRTYIYIIHIFLVAPLLIYSGYIGNKLSIEENEKYKKFFYLIITIGIIVILYHSSLLYKVKNGS